MMYYAADQSRVNLALPIADLLLPGAPYAHDVRPAIALAPYHLSVREQRQVESELELHRTNLLRRLNYLFPQRARDTDELMRGLIRPYQARHSEALSVLLQLTALDQVVQPLVAQHHQAQLTLGLIQASLSEGGQANEAVYALQHTAFIPLWSALRRRSAHGLEAQIREEMRAASAPLLRSTDVYPELRLWPSWLASADFSLLDDGAAQTLRGWLSSDPFWIMPPRLYHERAWLGSVSSGLQAVFDRVVSAVGAVCDAAPLTGQEQVLARQGTLDYAAQLRDALRSYVEQANRANL